MFIPIWHRPGGVLLDYFRFGTAARIPPIACQVCDTAPDDVYPAAPGRYVPAIGAGGPARDCRETPVRPGSGPSAPGWQGGTWSASRHMGGRRTGLVPLSSTTTPTTEPGGMRGLASRAGGPRQSLEPGALRRLATELEAGLGLGQVHEPPYPAQHGPLAGAQLLRDRLVGEAGAHE